MHFQIESSTGVLTVNNSTALNYETSPTFTLVINVQDNGAGSLSDQANITVNLTDVNEAPQISNQTFSIAENTANGQQVGTVAASDPDAGQTLSYSIISGNTSNAFQIGSSTGILTVNNSTALNYETSPTFILVIKVQDNGAGSLSDQANITVNLTDVNEAPQISNQTFSIAENTANGQQVGTVAASDPDASQTLTYTILSGNTNNAFQINSLTGVLTVNNSAALNYETTPTFTLVIKVEDNGAGSLSDQANITVNLTDVNEAPQISNQVFSVAENTPAGEDVGQVEAMDPDNGQTLAYAILSGNTENAFTLNSSTGMLTVSNSDALNSSVNPIFNLMVEVTDNGTGNLSSQATVTVNVSDVNQPPQINNQTFSIPENTSNGQQVGIVIATDPDAGQTLTYTILTGNINNAFQIGSSTGVLTVNNSAALNYETTPTFSLVIKVEDNGAGSLSDQANITVNLTDVNEAPQINSQTFSIAENATNEQEVGTVAASDPDNGQTLSFTILSGNTDNAFQIGSSTGTLTVNNSAALNYETTPTFTLVIKVEDNGAGSLSDQANIIVNLTDVNEAPQINSQTFSIAENATNEQEVGTVAASDPDNGQTLSFTILSGNTDNAFQIGSSTGTLTVNNSAALNYETTPIFTLVIKVEDNGAGSLSDQANITVNLTDVNEAPQINSQTFSIAENATNEQEVGTVAASDPDNGQTLSFTILSGNTDNAFQIGSSTGTLTVNNSAALNYETTPTFTLVIKVEDNGAGSLSDQANIIVNLTDVNEAPQINSQTFSIAENATNEQEVGTVAASDPDNGQTLSFTILSGNTDNAFQIGSSTGTLTVNNSAALNYETTPIFTLVIKVEDNGAGSLSDQANITVNLTDVNEAPQINSQTFSIAENAANEQEVGTVAASDPDNGQTLSFTILSGNTNNAFQIGSSTGTLTVNNSAALNYETTPTFTLVIKVEDNGAGSLSDQANITVNLMDVNEAPQISNQEFSVDEYTSAGEEVGQVIATDPDNGQSLIYAILDGNTDMAFAINFSTGVLTVFNSSALNFMVNPVFNLIVEVTDNGTGNLSTQAMVTINVTEILGLLPENHQITMECNIFPNPVKEFLNFEVANLNESKLKISIQNTSGELLFIKEYNENGGEITDMIDVSQLSKGFYIIKFQNGTSFKLKKFVVMK